MTEVEKQEIVELTIDSFLICQQEANKEKKDRWLHNTRKLMEHYNTLNTHSQKAVSTLEEAFAIDDIFTVEESKEICISSIKKSSAKTFVIMQHVNEMLRLLEENYSKTNRERKYRIFKEHYINQKTFREIAEIEVIDKRTAYRDADEVIETLSILLFGIEELVKT